MSIFLLDLRSYLQFAQNDLGQAMAQLQWLREGELNDATAEMIRERIEEARSAIASARALAEEK